MEKFVKNCSPWEGPTLEKVVAWDPGMHVSLKVGHLEELATGGTRGSKTTANETVDSGSGIRNSFMCVFLWGAAGETEGT